jgi:hypothetical protein
VAKVGREGSFRLLGIERPVEATSTSPGRGLRRVLALTDVGCSPCHPTGPGTAADRARRGRWLAQGRRGAGGASIAPRPPAEERGKREEMGKREERRGEKRGEERDEG